MVNGSFECHLDCVPHLQQAMQRKYWAPDTSATGPQMAGKPNLFSHGLSTKTSRQTAYKLRVSPWIVFHFRGIQIKLQQTVTPLNDEGCPNICPRVNGMRSPCVEVFRHSGDGRFL